MTTRLTDCLDEKDAVLREPFLSPAQVQEVNEHNARVLQRHIADSLSTVPWERGYPRGKYYPGMTDDYEVRFFPMAVWHRRRIRSRVMVAGSAWDGISTFGPSNAIECTVEIVEADRVFVKPKPATLARNALRNTEKQPRKARPSTPRWTNAIQTQ